MGKSSSSLKKKRSKDSSRSRSRKKSKIKSGRNKSKKFRHRDDSVSYSHDSDSRTSVSASSSSWEDDYRSRRSRSRTRRDVKGGKNRPRRRSSSSEDSEDSHCLRKRKRSKRNDYKGKKRAKPRKKHRRDVSVSTTSVSCSTCSGGSSSSDESESERKRGRSGIRGNGRRRFDNIKSRHKRSRGRSRSCSSCGGHSESSGYWREGKLTGESSGYGREDKLTGEGKSRRLRSVITVVKDDNNDGNKEEIVYDHDDCPSCRSNDSNDEGSKRELSHHSDVAFEKKRHVEDEKGEEAIISNSMTGRLIESEKHGEDQHDRSNLTYDASKTVDPIRNKSSQISGADDRVNGDDLESVLRQRALENLKRFRGGIRINLKTPINVKDKSSNKVKPPSTTEVEPVQVKSSKVDGGRVGGATPLLKSISVSEVRKDLLNNRKILDGNDGVKESRATNKNSVSTRDTFASGCPKNKVHAISGSTNKPKLISSVWRREVSTASTTQEQSITLQESLCAELISGNSVHKSAAETSETLTPNSNNGKDEVNNACDSTSEQPSSCPKPSDKLQDETKEGAQFEQKTMSVMRGGEMVQVSYKVYIPKKAPALARRQLKR